MRDVNLEHAVGLLPPALRQAFNGIDNEERARTEEIRLRAGRQVMLACARYEWALQNAPIITPAHINQTLENVTRSSLHSSAESLRHGFITSANGCRVGVCGTAAVRAGEVGSLREISSLCVRVARQKIGIGEKLLPELMPDRTVANTLIISPPGFGKTTLLRDIIRLISERGIRVSVADERGEIAAVTAGIPGFDVGGHTDVLTGVPKEKAVMMLLRTMTPEVIALDEISEEEDARAVRLAANCGVSIIATVHGLNRQDVISRPVFGYIKGIFKHAVIIDARENKRIFKVEEF